MTMTCREAAARLRRLARSFDKIGDKKLPRPAANLDEDLQVGAACMLSFIEDLFTAGGKESFTRGEVLVLLNLLRNDPDIFTMDLIRLMDLDPVAEEEE